MRKPKVCILNGSVYFFSEIWSRGRQESLVNVGDNDLKFIPNSQIFSNAADAAKYLAKTAKRMAVKEIAALTGSQMN